MQNRFRFRVWNKKVKKMYDVKSMSYIDGVVKRIEVQGDIGIAIFDEYGKHIDNCVLMQCTGLKDHTGKLIYEGDIVKLSYNGGQIPLFSDDYTESPEPDIFLVKYSEDWQAYFCQQINDSCPMAKDLSGLHKSLEEQLYPNDADVKKRVELNHAILVNDYDKYSQVIGNMYENADLFESYIKKYKLSEVI